MAKRRLAFGYGPVVRYVRRRTGGYASSNRSFMGYGMRSNVNMSLPYSATLTNNRQRVTSGTGVTTQYDRKTVYRKKYMPKRKKKAWKRFVKKVGASLMKAIGTKTVVLNDALEQTIVGNTQSWVSIAIYGKNGANSTTTSCGMIDLDVIFRNDAELVNSYTSRAQFFSAVLDITIANNSYYTDGVTTNDNLSIEVDVYEVVFKKDGIDANRLSELVNQAQSNTPLINTGVPEIALVNRGVTPWDLPDMLSRGVSIVKKTKYMLSKGQVATYQFRDPRNMQFRTDNIIDSDSNFAIKGKTRGFFVVFKGVPTMQPAAVTKKMSVGVTRKYGYKVIKNNTDADNYFTV